VAFYSVVSLYSGFYPTTLELAAVGTATLVGYNVAKYIHLLRKKFRFHVAIKVLTFVCSIIALFAVINLGMYAVLLFIFCGVLTCLYSLPKILGRSFRQVPILKLITIGISWSIIAVLLPYLITDSFYFKFEDVFDFSLSDFPTHIWWKIVKYSLFVIALCIPFEIRDLKYDSPKLRTLPQLIGSRNSRYVGVSLLLICVLIEFTQYEENSWQSITTFGIFTISAVCIWLSKRFKTDYYASFFVESIPLVWLGLYVAFNA